MRSKVVIVLILLVLQASLVLATTKEQFPHILNVRRDKHHHHHHGKKHGHGKHHHHDDHHHDAKKHDHHGKKGDHHKSKHESTEQKDQHHEGDAVGGITKEVTQSVTHVDEVMMTTIFHGAQCPNPSPSKNRPNGSVNFLTCGINDEKGWNPAPVKVEQLKVISGEEATKKEAFKTCKPYLKNFKKMAKKHNIPEIIPMSFSLQESTCNPHCKGENGEIGMMQITPANAKQFGVNPNDAWDPDTNIELGIKQFKQYLDQYHGNVLAAIGSYNGWNIGMTKQAAMSEKYGCFAQRNLDYLDSFTNGWLRGKDGNSKEFETFNNLAKCGPSS